jgi:hypothetical protein
LAGWEEAYTNEYESLGQQMIMAKEEQRLLRADILKRNEELKLLNQELEEAYIELDNLGENCHLILLLQKLIGVFFKAQL